MKQKGENIVNKKMGSIVICMLMAVSLVNANINSVNAEDNINQPVVQADQNNSDPSGKCGENATWTLSSNCLIIKGTGKVDGDFRDDVPDFDTAVFEISIEDGITSIGDNAFDGCKALKTIYMSDTVTSIGEEAFGECDQLKNVQLSNNLTEIGDYAFFSYDDSSLESITFPKGLKKIGEGAFRKTKLVNVTLPRSLESIGSASFGGCEKLESIDVEAGNQNFVSKDGILYSKDETKIVAYPGNHKNITNVVVPQTVTTIGAGAFLECKKLTNITIPNSVTSIESRAFYGCGGLTSIQIPNSVTSVGNSAFNGCTNLSNVTLSNNMTSISEDTFVFCTSLESITIPDSVKSIGNGAFYKCSNLKKVVMPNSVKNIGEVAFAYTRLAIVSIPNGVESIGDGAFKGCTKLGFIVIPKTVTTIGKDVFQMSNRVTLLVEEGSKALEYAKNNGYNYVAISLNSSEMTMNVGDTKQLTATVTNQDGTLSDSITWTSDNEDVATVDAQGIVTAKTAGTAIITATTSQGAQTTCVVTVKDKKVELISIEKMTVILSQDTFTYSGKENKPTVTVKNGNAVLKEGTDYTVTYKNNVQVGTAQVIVTGIGDYEGTVTKTFTIQKNNALSTSKGNRTGKKVDTSDNLSTILPLITMGVSAMLAVGLYVTRKRKAE